MVYIVCMKLCRNCAKEKPLEEYSVRHRGNGKFTVDFLCKPCRREVQRERNKNYVRPKKFWLDGLTEEQILEKKRKRSRKYRYETYGLHLEELEERLEAQYGHCATCFTSLTLDSFSEKSEETIKPGHVDHDHKTGKVRGILCSKCNHALGLVNDDESILKAMISYLKEYSE